MRKMVLGTLVALPLALTVSTGAVEERETTTMTTYSGAISDVSPSSSTIVVKSEDSPQTMKYVYDDKTLWVDPAGDTVTMQMVRNQPVTIYYQKEGDQTVVTKVVSRRSSTKLVKHKALKKVVGHKPLKKVVSHKPLKKVASHKPLRSEIIEQKMTTTTVTGTEAPPPPSVIEQQRSTTTTTAVPD